MVPSGRRILKEGTDMADKNVDYLVQVEGIEEPILVETAYLSNDRDYTIFKYAEHIIRFRSPYSLEKYTEVKEWDKGNMTVMAKYTHNDEPEEEYIDLKPILEELYIDADEFVENIKEVQVKYE